MIGRLAGLVIEKKAPWILIDVQGVGYEVQVPMTTYYEIPELGQSILLHIHFVVREDAQLLYGFHSVLDRSLFRQLLKISGVGPKLALTLLSGMEAVQLMHCLERADVQQLVGLPGVGKKTAERIVMEMKDKLGQVEGAGFTPQLTTPVAVTDQQQAELDAEQALISLGYKDKDANKMIKAVAGEAQTSEAMIRLALKKVVAA